MTERKTVERATSRKVKSLDARHTRLVGKVRLSLIKFEENQKVQDNLVRAALRKIDDLQVEMDYLTIIIDKLYELIKREGDI